MYIRIQFEDLGSEKTKETQSTFFGSPSGTCLSSMYSHHVCSPELRKRAGTSIVFWHLDVNVLNKHYGGAIDCLWYLQKYPGVAKIDILPVEGSYESFKRKMDDLYALLDKYIDGAVL